MTDTHNGLVSVVIPTHNEGDNLVDTVDCVLRNSSGRGIAAIEAIVVDDGSTDGSIERLRDRYDCERVRIVSVPDGGKLGVAHARNRGALHARGSMYVFLDAHCFVPEGWLPPLVDALAVEGVGLAGPTFASIANPDVRACGITWSDASLENVWLPPPADAVPVPFHIGACHAVSAAAFWDVGGFDSGMTRWGSEDIELCLRMWLLGYSVYAHPGSTVYHLFRTAHTYHVELSNIIFNRLRMAMMHFDACRLERVIEVMRGLPTFERSLTLALTGDTVRDRDEMLARHVRQVDWLFDRFGIDIGSC